MDDPRAAIHSLARRDSGADRLLFGQPVKATAAHVTAAMRPEEAFRVTLSDCLAQIGANAASLRSLRSVEGLHQLRVAFRRLDVALGAFGREFRQPWLAQLRGRAKILSRRLAPARDLDVFVDSLLVKAPQGDGLEHLRDCAQAARDIAWDAVATCIAGQDFRLFLDDVSALAGSRLPLTHRSLPRTAARILDRQMRRVKTRGKKVAPKTAVKTEGDLHRLRIALKKLRYTAEFFAPLYGKGKVKRYLRRVRALQDDLGDLNDAANVRAVIGDLLRGAKAVKPHDGGLRFAAGALVGWYGAQTPRAVKRALKHYDRFRRITPFWR